MDVRIRDGITCGWRGLWNADHGQRSSEEECKVVREEGKYGNREEGRKSSGWRAGGRAVRACLWLGCAARLLSDRKVWSGGREGEGGVGEKLWL